MVLEEGTWRVLVEQCSVVVMEAGGRDFGVGAGRGEEGAGGGKNKKYYSSCQKISSVTCPPRQGAELRCSAMFLHLGSLACLSAPQLKLWQLGLIKKKKPFITFICKDCLTEDV